MGSTEDDEDVQGVEATSDVNAIVTASAINDLVQAAEDIALADGSAHHTWLEIEREPLRNAMAEAYGTAFTAVLNAKATAEETATLVQQVYGQEARPSNNPPPKRRHVLAAHAAAALVVDADKIIPGPTLALTDGQRIRGASEYAQWWAFSLASSVAKLPEFPDTPRRLAIEERFFKSLARLSRDNPDQRQSTTRALAEYLAQLATDESMPRGPEVGPTSDEYMPPGQEVGPASRPRQSTLRRWWSSANALRVAVIVLSVAILVAGGLLVKVTRGHENTIQPASITPEAAPALVPATFDAPVLADASLQVFGYPKDSPLDPSVQAVPDHPAQHPATVDVGQVFTVEIRLTKTSKPGIDPTENFFLGFWTSALIKPLSEKTTMIPPNTLEKNAPPLNRYPDTMVENLETKVPLVFKIPVVAIPQMETDGPPDEQYNCGFNTTQVVNVLLASSSHTIPVVATLPVSVRRTEGCH